MHHCLEIQEILLAIFHEISVGKPPNGDGVIFRHNLTLLARTCRAFYEPAMNILWYTIEDLSPLFKCLPEDLWYEQEEGFSGITEIPIMTLSIQRSLSPSEWTSVVRHACRVKVLDCKAGYDDFRGTSRRISGGALKEILLHCNAERGPSLQFPKTLFPNLIQLVWSWDRFDEAWISCFPCLAGESLKELCVVINRPPPTPSSIDTMREVLSGTPQRHPFLESLELPHFYMGWLGISDLTPHLLQSFPRLKRVALASSLTDGTFDCLAHLPDLRHLRVPLLSTLLKHPSTGHLSLKSFPVLTEVELNVPNIKHCNNLLRHISSASLRAVEVTCTNHEVIPADVRTLCDTLQKQRDLNILRIHSRTRGTPHSAHSVIPSTIYPLLLLPNITDLVLSLKLRVDLDDELIQSMAASWPNLTRLEIPHYETPSLSPERPRVTLAGLMPLASCIRLRSLSLAVYISPPNAFEQRQVANLRRGNTTLSQFDLYWWNPIDLGSELDPCVRFLLNLFPLVYKGFRTHRINVQPEFDANPRLSLGWRTFQSAVFEYGFRRHGG